MDMVMYSPMNGFSQHRRVGQQIPFYELSQHEAICVDLMGSMGLHTHTHIRIGEEIEKDERKYSVNILAYLIGVNTIMSAINQQ